MQIKRIGLTTMSIVLMLAAAMFTAKPASAETHFSIGIGVGPGYGYYAPSRVVYRPPYPRPGYFWTDGYYDPYGEWVAGYWAPRAYVAPGYYQRGSYGGYRRDFDRDDHRRFDRDDHRRFDRHDFREGGDDFGRRR
jgi:hypothetical protein